MASISQVQHNALEDGFIDLLGDDFSKYEKVELKDVEDTILQIAVVYIDLLRSIIDERDIKSSGELANKIRPTDIEVNGSLYTIGVLAPEYASYQDEGVNGWAKNRGSRFQFRTKGVNPKGEMVRSIKEWINREGSSSRNVKVGVSSRERRGMDLQTANAMRVSYMIKREGLKATHFWRDATKGLYAFIEKELGIAIKIDIINNLTP